MTSAAQLRRFDGPWRLVTKPHTWTTQIAHTATTKTIGEIVYFDSLIFSIDISSESVLGYSKSDGSEFCLYS
jgi:hypothetical protein